MKAQKEALVSKRPWKASILWTPSVITPLQSIHSANVWASAVESGAACVNSLWNQFIKGGLKIKVNDCNSKGQTDLSLGSATPPLLPLLVLIRGSRSTHHRGTCPSLSTATSLTTAAAGPSQVSSSRGTVKGNVHMHTMECHQPEWTIKLHSFQKNGCNWRQSYQVKWTSRRKLKGYVLPLILSLEFCCQLDRPGKRETRLHKYFHKVWMTSQ